MTLAIGERRYSRNSQGQWHQVFAGGQRTRPIISPAMSEALEFIYQLQNEEEPF